jgi:hypothetical protein
MAEMGCCIAERGVAEEMFCEDDPALASAVRTRLGLELLPDIRDSFGSSIPVIIFSCRPEDVPSDEHLNALSKMNSSPASLGIAVRDRLAPTPPQPVRKIA